MFKKIWREVKRPFVAVKQLFLAFHRWVGSIAPGLKTKLVAALGFIGSTAGLLQEFVTGLPLSQLIGATEALLVTSVLFALAFWFRSMRNDTIPSQLVRQN